MPYVLRKCENGATIKIYEPNAKEIRSACLEVQKEWTQADALSRLGHIGGVEANAYEVPMVNLSLKDLSNLGF